MATTHLHEITNSCTCQVYDPETDECYDAPNCYGDCWEQVLDDFAEDTKKLRESNPTNWWKVTDLVLWHGPVSGYFYAKNVSDLIQRMTVNSEWIMRYTVHEDRVEYSLSHHDSLGGETTLTAVTDDEADELGLF